jgi:hypothetical protein
MFDAAGRVRSLHARAVSADVGVPKGLSPAGYTVGGLAMADPLARLLLAGEPLGDGMSSAEAVGLYDLVIVEGVPDFLTWATRWGDAAEAAPAVMGVISGSWTDELAARVPDGTCVVIRVHQDGAGAKYAATIKASLDQRCRVRIASDAGAS